MEAIAEDFLASAAVASQLLREPAVGERWEDPSALPEFSVRGLAGHLAHQVLRVRDVLDNPVEGPVRSLLGHYESAEWVDTPLDAEINVWVRRSGEQTAEAGQKALADRFDAALAELRGVLAREAPERLVRMPWVSWTVRLDDFLVTRMLELMVHTDDLAVSVDLPTPLPPPRASDRVLTLLSQLAARRHGPTPVLRALSRAERAPTMINAI